MQTKNLESSETDPIKEKKYDPKSEYHVDLEDPKIKASLEKAQKLYSEFVKNNTYKLNISDESSVHDVYQKAIEAGIFDNAKSIRELIFGKDIHFYGVSYLWDTKCANDCIYCPASRTNIRKTIEEGKTISSRELTIDQAVRDTKAVMKDGHTHICYLTTSTPSIKKYPDKIIPYLREIIEKTKEDGLKEIILNIEPLTEEGFRKIVEAVKKPNEKFGTNVSLQFRVFQETYNRETYKKMHPRGPKSDYDFRMSAQTRALKAGFDNIGLGALFGLHKYPLEEIENLKKHAESLERESGKIPARICLPSGNELENIGVTIPHFLTKEIDDYKKGTYEEFNELIYALARLAMPTINIVSSERDRPAMLETLNQYATCSTLNVHPGVGDNAKIFQEEDQSEETHFEQASVFPRDPKKTLKCIEADGYKPIM